MSRPRFLADHDLNDHIVQGVRRRQPAVHFQRVRELGMEEQSDAEILDFAAGEGLIVVSHDVSTMSAAAFARLAAGEPLAGLLLAHQFYPIAPIIESLVLIWSASEAEEFVGEVRFLPL
jgi:hypothetical protein